MYREGVGLKKMPNGRVLALPGVNEASAIDASLPGLVLYVADAAKATVDVLKLSDSRSRQGLIPDVHILKLSQVGRMQVFNILSLEMAYQACCPIRRILSQRWLLTG